MFKQPITRIKKVKESKNHKNHNLQDQKTKKQGCGCFFVFLNPINFLEH